MHLFKSILILLLLCLMLFAGWMVYFSIKPVELPAPTIELDLKSGSSLRSVAQQLVRHEILSEPWSFVLLVRAFGKAGEIQAGNYLIEDGVTPYQLFIIFTEGSTRLSSITFIEGWTFQQMRNALNMHDEVKHMTMAYTDQQILQEIGANASSTEGLFFPDTYHFSKGMSDKEILKRAYAAMQTNLAEAWEKRAPGLPYASPYEALIMASIVEKETGKASERAMIAGVFLNRLRIGMRLQTDPTVIYGMGDAFDGNLRKQDLQKDTPYNTYTRTGLPPTPIAMPGRAAIEAALHPVKTKALYFVGRGDGSHVFSNSLLEHNRAVSHYQLGRRKK